MEVFWNGGTTHFINTHHAGLAPFQRHLRRVWATQVAVSPQKGRATEIVYEAPSPPRVCGPNVGRLRCRKTMVNLLQSVLTHQRNVEKHDWIYSVHIMNVLSLIEINLAETYSQVSVLNNTLQVFATSQPAESMQFSSIFSFCTCSSIPRLVMNRSWGPWWSLSSQTWLVHQFVKWGWHFITLGYTRGCSLSVYI